MKRHIHDAFKPLTVSICIPAYNEEKSIAYVLKRVLNTVNNVGNKDFMVENVVVVSESTDRTNEIVREFGKLDTRVKLLEGHKRLGLSGAISLFLKRIKSDVIVVIDADVFLSPNSLRALLLPFRKWLEVYATSGRKIPISNSPMVHAFWKVHHELCLLRPKLCSSIIAFRGGIIKEIPRIFGTPDTYIQAVLERKGLRILYVPQARGLTLEPNTIRGFIAQRRRIYIQHLLLEKALRYRPPAFNPQLYLVALVRALLNDRKTKALNYLACAILEFFGRLLGLWRFRREYHKSYVWEKVR
jgi:cellulose synthase/poly-beta-1,6-N-acetylglucosamine synthase-like glycosyltransferase